MHTNEFLDAQRAMARNALFDLFMSCRRRFLDSAFLLEIQGPTIDKLVDSCVSTEINLLPLMNAYETLASRYTSEYFSPQSVLFHNLEDPEDLKWSKYFYHVLVPTLVQNNIVVRNILRALLVLPSQSAKAASEALEHEFSEMTLPKVAPLWAPEYAGNY